MDENDLPESTKLEIAQKKIASKESYRKKLCCYQAWMFSLCCVCYSSVHIYREFWSVSKPEVEEQGEKYGNISKQDFSNVETVNFMVYGLSQFVNGPLADEFNHRVILPISYFLQALIFACIAIIGFKGGDGSLFYFYALQTVLGIVQSICFPAYVSLISNWFSSKNRGFATASFCTCINVGNIIGAQLGKGLVGVFDNQWQYLFVILAV